MPQNRHLRFFIIIMYTILASLGLWFSFNYALPVLAPFIIAFLLAKLIEVPVDFCTTKLRFPRALSSALWTVIAFGGVGTGVYYLFYALFREISDFLKSLPDAKILISEASDFINNMSINIIDALPDGLQNLVATSFGKLVNEAVSLARSALTSLGSVAASALGSVPSILLFIIAVLAATYFLSSDYPNLRKTAMNNLPKKWTEMYSKVRIQSIKTLFLYIRALGIVWCVTFIELTIGFAILRLDYVLVLAFFISLIDVLPVFGVGTILIPWALIELILGNFPLAIGLAVLYGVIVIIRNIIEPKIVGSQIGLNPLITLFSVYVGLKFFGVFGLFTPILVVIGKQIYLCFRRPNE